MTLAPAGTMSPQAGPSPARVIALVRPVTWQPAPDRRIPDVRGTHRPHLQVTL